MTGGHRRILVVEDDPETAGQLVESLKTSSSVMMASPHPS
jgi:two-component system OmpR family response regulator